MRRRAAAAAGAWAALVAAGAWLYHLTHPLPEVHGQNSRGDWRTVIDAFPPLPSERHVGNGTRAEGGLAIGGHVRPHDRHLHVHVVRERWWQPWRPRPPRVQIIRAGQA